MNDNIEIKLSELWCKLLDIDNINKDTDLFDEGGNSLHISMMKDTLRDETGIDVPVEIFYTHPAFGDLLNEIKKYIQRQ